VFPEASPEPFFRNAKAPKRIVAALQVVLVCLFLPAVAQSAPAAPDVETVEKLITEANSARSEWREASLWKALSNYDLAAEIFLRLHRHQRASNALMEAGAVEFSLGQYRAALERYHRSWLEAKAARDDLQTALALSETGRMYSLLGDNGKAQTACAQAREFFEGKASKDPSTNFQTAYARALKNSAEVQYSEGNLLMASQNFRRALDLFVKAKDEDREAGARLFLGYIAGSLGDPTTASAEISHALTIYRSVGDKSGEGMCLTALGIASSLNREIEHALKLHSEAREIFQKIGDRQSEGVVLNGWGQAFEDLSNYQAALEKYREAFQLFEANGSLDFVPVVMFKIARTRRIMGDNDGAIAAYQQCFKLSRAARKTRTEANALNDLALMYAARQDRQNTIAQYRRILKFYESNRDRRSRVVALNNLADFYLRIGENTNALRTYQQSLSLSDGLSDKPVKAATLYGLALTTRNSGRLDESLSYLRRSVDLIEGLRANVASPDYRTSYFAGVRSYYELEIDVLMQLERKRPGEGFATQAFLANENARARSLIDLVIEAGSDVRQNVTPQMLQRERELRALLRTQAQYEMDLESKGSSEADEVKKQIAELRNQYEQLEGDLREQNPRSTAVVKNGLELSEIQRQLDENTVLLEYSLGDDRSYLWMVTRDSLRSYELPPRKNLEALALESYKALTARQEFDGRTDAGYQHEVEGADALFEKNAASLGDMLLGAVASELGTKRLLIVAQGPLQFIPFDALPIPNDTSENSATNSRVRLIERHEVVMLPSFATLAAIRSGTRPVGSPDKVVAVLADPVFTSGDDRVAHQNDASVAAVDLNAAKTFPALREFGNLTRAGGTLRLIHAAEEADTIVNTVPRGAALVAKGFEANRETATGPVIGQYQIVHFATHSFLNSVHPELSGVVLSRVNRDGSSADGFIGLADIYHMHLTANLVVLSACDTALGKEVKGEGLVGLTHAFMSAGARGVVASLWKVDDRATAALMSEFYRAMLQDGLPPAAALRTAKEKIRGQKTWSAPYYWAGFVLQGEYKDPIAIRNHTWRSAMIFFALALGFILSVFLILRQRRNRRPL